MNCLIIGSGSWGTALGQVLADNFHQVIVYGINQNQVDDINLNHQNKAFFGDDVFLNPKIRATSDLKAAVKAAEVIVISVPSSAMRSVLNDLLPLLTERKYFINTAKGLERGTDLRMSDVIRDVVSEDLRYPIVSLIGPSHAEEVILRQVTLLTATSLDLPTAEVIQTLFANEYFRVYTNTDEIGAELGVAMKNAIAIASGALAGLGYGDNARAALITRGLHEMSKFGVYFGAKAETFLGLSGLGDLVVTCNSHHSRNFKAGYEIGRANSAKAFLKNNTTTVEGIYATQVIHEIACKNKLELPIVNAIYEVLFNDAEPRIIVRDLMLRPLKDEKEK